MNRLAPPYRGQVAAAAFVVDAGLVGVAEARRRVLAHWVPGAALRHVDRDRWLLTLPAPVTVRSEHAPGLPLVVAGRGWAAPDAGDDVPAGVVRLLDGGRPVERAVAGMPYVDVTAWVRTDGLRHTALAPMEAPRPLVQPPLPPEPPADVDLRARARVKEPSAKVRALVEELRAERGGRGGPAIGGRREPALGGPPLAPGRYPLRNLMARTVLRTPAGTHLARRYVRHVEQLGERLSKGDFEALRDAISLAGTAGFLSLRIPPPRNLLRASPVREHGGPGGPFGAQVEAYLRDIYRDTARRLEDAGRIDEAAFVLADLLDEPRTAVALLERHRRFAPAAELAEGRELPPPVVVRLWLLAGQADRAVTVARARGSFETAIRLLADHPAAATDLRARWAHLRAAVGDPVGAVEAAWPDESLRPLAYPWIAEGMAAGGSGAARLLAYLGALRPAPEVRAAALALVDSRDPERRAARDAFVETLAAVRMADPAADREVTTAALRAVVRAEPPPLWPDRTTRALRSALRERCDPLLRADVPASGPAAPAGGPAFAVLPELPGDLPVHDVAPLPAGLLVAHGEYGLRLLDVDGRVRQHWDTPAHLLVPSDSGTSAVVASRLDQPAWELHRLDVTARRLRRWLPIAARGFAPSYDGDLLPVVDMDGSISFLDATADRARVLWRELSGGAQTVALARSADTMAAVVLQPADAYSQERVEVWRWDLPDRTLRRRLALTFGDDERWVLTSTGLVAAVRRPVGEPATVVWNGGSRVDTVPWAGAVDLVSSGPYVALLRSTEDETEVDVDLLGDLPGASQAVLRFPAGYLAPDVRAHGDLVAVWDRSGRIAVVEPGARRVVTVLRTRA